MGILKKIKQTVVDQVSPAPRQEVLGEVFFTQMFKQNNNFRGHKRFRLSVVGYEPTEQGFADFLSSGSDLDEYTNIMLRGRKYENFIFVDVIVNGHFIGDIPNWLLDDEKTDFINNKLFAGSVTSVHVRLDEERGQIYLFLKAEQ